jgi:hypothetical protein
MKRVDVQRIAGVLVQAGETRLAKKVTAGFQIGVGPDARGMSWQKEFPETTPCCKEGCDGEARLGFVAMERNNKGDLVCDLYPNDPDGKGLWLHDLCAVAVYFCKKCLETTALYNQG